MEERNGKFPDELLDTKEEKKKKDTTPSI